MKFDNHSNYNCKITTDQGNSYLIYANWLHNNGLDCWKGWKCEAGSTRLSIDKNFDIWSGECHNDFLGNALDDFAILDASVCKRDTCTGCTDDLLLAKKYTHDR